MLEREYWLLRLRTSPIYVCFIIFQCLLSILIIILGIVNHEHLKHPAILTMEYILAITILLDILIRYKTELDFCKRNDNLFDIVLYVIIVILLISITAIHEGGFEIGLEADDIIALSVLIARYVMQIIRLIFLVKKSHQNLKLQMELREVEMVGDIHNKTDTLQNQHSQRIKEHIIRGLSEKTSYDSPTKQDMSDTINVDTKEFKHHPFKDDQEI